MTPEQVEAYASHVRILEITQKLSTDDVVPADRFRRSPSPPPEYDNAGRRINTRHSRYRDRLLGERHSLIQHATRIIPSYRLPVGYTYRSPAMLKEKVFIPVKDFPEVNFIGQILGPRGSSLKDMATKSGATILLRGKGSVKEGRGTRGGRGGRDRDNLENEPLHCLVIADTRDKIDKARILIQGTIEMAATTPEHANDRKRQQLRALAVANGTFRDDEGLRGVVDETYMSNVTCRVCGGHGHIARDFDRTAKY
ncbi:hypothetical protein B0H63DRAFT_497677 [Podospora didyma]|uniref:Branchpoint-bridging protein n=1 Tax=Podospora didyma TaxID=330526 RepID=A0AAE0K1H7_9PEZI|nr:hypothetical protein B0H63DRAFT_497677 [Podospora didyma]